MEAGLAAACRAAEARCGERFPVFSVQEEEGSISKQRHARRGVSHTQASQSRHSVRKGVLGSVKGR